MCISEDKQVRKKGLWGCGAMKKSLVVMKRLTLICVGLVLFCSGLVGCVSSGGTQRSLIDDQTFYSDGTPEMQVTVTDKPDAVFHSKDRKPRKFAAGSGTYNEDSEQYVFLNLDGKKIKSGVLIAYDKMSEGYYLPNVFRDDQISFDSGKKNIDGKNFQSFLGIYSATIFRGPIIEKIEQTNVIIPNFYIVKAFGRRVGVNNRIRIYVLYFENLNYSDETQYSYADWKDIKLISDDQKQILKDMKKRAENAFVISHTRELSVPVIETQNDTFKSKLSLLKESYEANLITKEEYEAKRKKLLDKL